MSEQVLVVARQVLAECGLLPTGFSAQGCEGFLEAVRLHGVFRPRAAVEDDPSLKQVIPYAVVRSGGKVFLFRRTSRGGEARLHQKLSIGVGGHINPEGVPQDRLVEAGLRRELEEELTFDGAYTWRPVGLINDDGNPVGRVHIGIVFEVDLGTGLARVRESDVLEGEFVEPQDLTPCLGRMESWSARVAEGLFPGVLEPSGPGGGPGG